MLKDILKGFVIGAANIIPGVSGGTMALVLGIYHRLINAINSIDSRFIKSFLSLFLFKKGALDDFMENFKRAEGYFLIRLAVGGGVAIIGLAKLLGWLLNTHHDPTYGFFCGLVLISIYEPFKLVKSWNIKSIIFFLVALGLIFSTTAGVSNDKLIERAKRKAIKRAVAHKLARIPAAVPKDLAQIEKAFTTVDESPQKNKKFIFTKDISKLLKFFLFGAIAITAMVLPGISGSFVLLLLGAYFDILNAVNVRDLSLLAFFAAGCGVGIILFSRVIDYLLKKYADITMAFMTGLVMGSIYVIWPFKATQNVMGTAVYLNNIIPAGFDSNAGYTFLAFVIGAIIVLACMKLSSTDVATEKAI